MTVQRSCQWLKDHPVVLVIGLLANIFGIVQFIHIDSIGQSVTTGSKDSFKTSFACGIRPDTASNEPVYYTMANTERGSFEIIRWQTNFFKDYSPQDRCLIVSPKIQKAYNNGSLNYITNGIDEKTSQPVICVSDRNGKCEPDGLLFTLRPFDKPDQILRQLEGNLQGRAVNAVQHSKGSSVVLKVDVDKALAQRQPQPKLKTVLPWWQEVIRAMQIRHWFQS